MSKISATDFIKMHNPENISGTVKDSLTMLQNLKKSNGLVSVFDALGHNEIINTLKDFVGRLKAEEDHIKQQVQQVIQQVQQQAQQVVTQIEKIIK